MQGEAQAETAEALMRSRYSAFAVGNVEYIVATHHPESRDEVDPDEIERWSTQSEWLGLEILECSGGGPEDSEGTVLFTARFSDPRGKIRTHRERAIFKRSEGRWFFFDGEVQTVAPRRREAAKIGRNDPCPCGSGKKHKKCCGRPGAGAS